MTPRANEPLTPRANEPLTQRANELLPVLARINQSDRRLSLAEAAALAASSPSHFQRRFTKLLSESPTQYQRRQRLERGASLLLSTEARIIDVAVAVGFESHEAFTRAFRSHFGVSPKTYRTRSQRHGPAATQWVLRTGPCVAVYGIDLSTKRKEPAMTYEIERQTLVEVPVLFSRRRVDREHFAEVLADVLPAVFGYAMETGLAMTGPPFVRYVDQSAAFFEIEAGVPLAEPAVVSDDRPEIVAGSLPAGDAAVTIHVGPYDQLGDAHVALDRWMNEHSVKPSGGPWEIYLTDPAEVPDPADWQTQVVWPLI